MSAATISKRPKLQASGHSDHFQTPASALDALMPYLPTGLIWEPACGKGNLVNGLAERGRAVIGTDIMTGHDFLTYAPAVFDLTICNPPFSIKDRWLARCYELGKPFALLLPVTVFDSDFRRNLMRKNGVQILLPSGRIHYETPKHEQRVAEGKKSSAWFYSCWICWGFDMPRDLMFAEDALVEA